MAHSISYTSSWKRLAVVAVIIEILGAGLFFFWKDDANASSSSSTSTHDSLSISHNISVVVDTARTMQVAQQAHMLGTVHAGQEVQIVSETQGRVLKVYAEQGTLLPAGAPIASVDAVIKEGTLKLAKATHDKAKKDYERFVQLYKEQSVTAVEVEQYKLALANAEYQLTLAQRQYDDATLRTPIAGLLAERSVTVGSMIQPGMTVATILDMQTLKIKAQVAEDDVFRLTKGQAVTIMSDVYPNVQFRGTIAFIGDRADQARTYTVEIHLQNSKQNPLKAGQTVRLQCTLPMHNALVIPRSALVGNGTERSVYVLQPQSSSIPVKRNVSIGQSYGSTVEVTYGLQAGDLIITSGAQTLRPNVPVQVQQAGQTANRH